VYAYMCMCVCITYWGELSGGNVLPKTGGGITAYRFCSGEAPVNKLVFSIFLLWDSGRY